jgi:atypical dual specificity phosphatase
MESHRADIVLNRLYIGSLRVARDCDLLRSLNVTHVLTVCPTRPNHFEGICYKLVSIPDSPNHRIDLLFDECFEFINSALANGGTVLVHCFQGVSRSASVVIAYLMKYKKMKFDRAFEFLKKRRSIVNPNFGFVDQLKNFESTLRLSQEVDGR